LGQRKHFHTAIKKKERERVTENEREGIEGELGMIPSNPD
jgi:hypothetical protein